jgi:late competence protein required for DNA uptake (superfamily II DNA/RNA helicase)
VLIKKDFAGKIQIRRKVKTKMATVGDFKKEFIDSVEGNLRCSQCKKVPRNATVTWCSKHHLMCQSCFNGLRDQFGKSQYGWVESPSKSPNYNFKKVNNNFFVALYQAVHASGCFKNTTQTPKAGHPL